MIDDIQDIMKQTKVEIKARHAVERRWETKLYVLKLTDMENSNYVAFRAFESFFKAFL